MTSPLQAFPALVQLFLLADTGDHVTRPELAQHSQSSIYIFFAQVSYYRCQEGGLDILKTRQAFYHTKGLIMDLSPPQTGLFKISNEVFITFSISKMYICIDFAKICKFDVISVDTCQQCAIIPGEWTCGYRQGLSHPLYSSRGLLQLMIRRHNTV